MLTEKEYRQQCHAEEEKRMRAERAARGEPEPEKGCDAPMPSGLTARQKLDRANANFQKRGSWTEPPLTEKELGMSQAEFERLSAQRRLEVANRAMFLRRAGA